MQTYFMQWETDGYVYDKNGNQIGYAGKPIEIGSGSSKKGNNNDTDNPFAVFLGILIIIIIYGVHKDYFSNRPSNSPSDTLLQTPYPRVHHSTHHKK